MLLTGWTGTWGRLIWKIPLNSGFKSPQWGNGFRVLGVQEAFMGTLGGFSLWSHNNRAEAPTTANK